MLQPPVCVCVCVREYSGGDQASWPNEKQSDNTIQAAHSSTYALQERDARGGEEAVVRSRGVSDPQRLKSLRLWTGGGGGGVFRMSLNLKPLCAAS